MGLIEPLGNSGPLNETDVASFRVPFSIVILHLRRLTHTQHTANNLTQI